MSLRSSAATAPWVRPFAEADIPSVAALHSRVFRPAMVDGGLEAYRRYFSEVFLAGGRGEDGLPSLVCERDGRILGFLGVAARRMVFRGGPIVMAICSQFAVEPAARGQVGLRLLKECFAGPQDLTISDEAQENTRAIWEWCGGDTVLPESLRWMRPLRPAQCGLTFLRRRAPLSFVARTLGPAARVADSALAAFGANGFACRRPAGSRETVDAAAFAEVLRDLTAHCALRPEHGPRSAAWALSRAGGRGGDSTARALLVRDDGGEPIGLTVHCVNNDRIAEVLLVAARPHARGTVLDHLFDEAMRQGAVAAAGRLDRALMAAVASERMLMHSRNAQLRLAVHRGDVFLSRLEGEWCLRFR